MLTAAPAGRAAGGCLEPAHPISRGVPRQSAPRSVMISGRSAVTALSADHLCRAPLVIVIQLVSPQHTYRLTETALLHPLSAPPPSTATNSVKTPIMPSRTAVSPATRQYLAFSLASALVALILATIAAVRDPRTQDVLEEVVFILGSHTLGVMVRSSRPEPLRQLSSSMPRIRRLNIGAKCHVCCCNSLARVASVMVHVN